jgi:phosphoribosylformylglycinamidine synthase
LTRGPSTNTLEFLTKVIPGAFLVEVENQNDLEDLETIFLGTVIADPELRVTSEIVLKLENMKKVWQETWYDILKLPHEAKDIDSPKNILKWKPSKLKKKTVNVVYTPGINCHYEMLRSWELLGCHVKLISVTDPKARFADADIVVFPGGFADGDYLGAAKVWNRVMETMFKDQMDYLRTGKIPVLGICNGFQLMTRSGFFGQNLRLTFNASGVFEQRWVRLTFTDQAKDSLWTKGLEGKELCVPVAHGEGQFIMDGPMSKATIALQYEPNVYPNNPNGSVHAIAGVFAGDQGQFFGMMPHPERAIEDFHFTQHGLLFFENILRNLS